MKTIKFLTIIAVIAVIFNSCSKGDTGTAGPTGATGAQGNANVSGSAYNVTSWGWLSPIYYATFNVSNLTSDIQNQGSVAVYVSIDAGTTWNSIPATYVGSVENAFWSFATQTGIVQVNFEWNDMGEDGDPNSTYATTIEIKVVCIAPAMIVKYPNTNWKNLAEVSALPEVKAVLNK